MFKVFFARGDVVFFSLSFPSHYALFVRGLGGGFHPFSQSSGRVCVETQSERKKGKEPVWAKYKKT